MPTSKCLIASVLVEERNVGISVRGIMSVKKKKKVLWKELGENMKKNIMYWSMSLEE